MNWSYIAIEALLPLVWALGATFLGGAFWALHLHRGGGSSRVALGRFLRALALIFPLTSCWLPGGRPATSSGVSPGLCCTAPWTSGPWASSASRARAS